MENRIYYKKYLKSIIAVGIIFIFLIQGIITLEHTFSRETYNKKVSSLITKIKEYNPEMSELEILNILNSSEVKEEPLKKYGYDVKKDDFLNLSKTNSLNYKISIILTTTGFILIIIYLFIKFSNKNDDEIDKLIKTLEKINHHNYDLELETLNEDKFSILKSEIYKTTIMLREVAQNSKLAKIDLKKSLSDISHQLKTPLTSILIMLDDIIDDKNMSSETREDFLNSIRREIVNINFLVGTLLKLSKIDADAIEFNRTLVSPKKLITSAIKNTEALADLKNVKIEKHFESMKNINCDEHWQTEAITNIIKNAIEHSHEKGTINIIVDSNDLYTSISIKDEGVGMDKHDVKHIFDRFYKGKNSSKDSIGIGLSLAKSIVEHDNGKIHVESKEGEGTTFVIKYFK